MLVVVGLDKYRLLTANYKLRFPGYILASQTNSSLSSCKRLPHVVCPTKYQLVVPAEVRSDSTLGVSCIVQRTFDFFFWFQAEFNNEGSRKLFQNRFRLEDIL